MDLHSFFNFPSARLKSPGGLRPASQENPNNPQATASAFITPQALAAFPLASGLVAAFWQAAQTLAGPGAKAPWVCFVIALILALVNYIVSISDPKLDASKREKQIGFLFALINGVYLFVTAVGIKVALTQ